jgi:TRAP-type C4-dicarboxylate transport system permease small subunit
VPFPRGESLRQALRHIYRIVGPVLVVWLALALVAGGVDATQSPLPEWRYAILNGLVAIVGFVLVRGFLAAPFVLHAAIALGREWRLGPPCWLFLLWLACVFSSSLGPRAEKIGEVLGWSSLAAAALAATWLAYRRANES